LTWSERGCSCLHYIVWSGPPLIGLTRVEWLTLSRLLYDVVLHRDGCLWGTRRHMIGVEWRWLLLLLHPGVLLELVLGWPWRPLLDVLWWTWPSLLVWRIE